MVRLNIEELKQPQKKGFFGSIGLPEPVRRMANSWSNGLYAASMYAQQGLGYVSSFAWIFATAAVVIYLPLLRAMDSDRETIRAIRVRDLYRLRMLHWQISAPVHEHLTQQIV